MNTTAEIWTAPGRPPAYKPALLRALLWPNATWIHYLAHDIPLWVFDQGPYGNDKSARDLALRFALLSNAVTSQILLSKHYKSLMKQRGKSANLTSRVLNFIVFITKRTALTATVDLKIRFPDSEAWLLQSVDILQSMYKAASGESGEAYTSLVAKERQLVDFMNDANHDRIGRELARMYATICDGLLERPADDEAEARGLFILETQQLLAGTFSHILARLYKNATAE